MSVDITTRTDICDLAALYALGALDGEDVWTFRTHLLDGCAECARELAEFEAATAELTYAAPQFDPSPILKDRLFDRIREPEPEIFRTEIPSDGEGWKPHSLAGIRFKTLNVDKAAHSALFLLQAEPGAIYPMHRHTGVEEMVMLSGELRIGNRVYGPGEYLRSEPGSIHQTGETAQGCMFLMRASLDDEIFA